MARGSVLAAVCGDESDEEVVRLACGLVKQKRSKLYILYVIEIPRYLPIDAEIPGETDTAEEVLTSMEAVARGMRCRPEAELLQSRKVGAAVVQEAVERDVATIVLGTELRREFGSFRLGDTVPYVLEHSPCEVIVYRGSA